MAGLLEMSEAEFVDRYTRLRPDRRGLALVDKENGECIFLADDICKVQSVKPQQCRDFPNLWRFPGFASKCHATPIEIDDEAEYCRRIVEATGRESFTPS